MDARAVVLAAGLVALAGVRPVAAQPRPPALLGVEEAPEEPGDQAPDEDLPGEEPDEGDDEAVPSEPAARATPAPAPEEEPPATPRPIEVLPSRADPAEPAQPAGGS